MDFAALSFKHRALLIALECLADEAGVVDWNLPKIQEVAGDGIDISRVDINKMGADHAVWMPDGGAILLSQFMKMQYGTLSRHCPAHSNVWKTIEKWWGSRPSIHDPEPFVDFFASKLISRHAPPIKNEAQGDHEPYWKTRSIIELAEVRQVVIPESLPSGVYKAMNGVFKWRERMIERARITSEGEKWMWTKDQADQMIDRVKSMLLKYTPESVQTQLENMSSVPTAYLMPPKDFKCNLLATPKEENHE